MLSTAAHVPGHLKKITNMREWERCNLSIILISPWVEDIARSPLFSTAYNKLKPQVTLFGSCFVTKSSSMPYDHFFFKSNMEWSRSSLNLDSIICNWTKCEPYELHRTKKI
jgi:hypothetical protein